MDIDVTKLPAQATNELDRLFVTVYSVDKPQNPSFKGFAKSVSAQDGRGSFDVLPQHENFVTGFSGLVTIIREDGGLVTNTAKDGVIEVANNIVRIFLKN